MTGPMLLGFGPPDDETPTPTSTTPEIPASSPPSRAAAPTQTQSLYRRYRPQSFDADDLVGQEHIVRTLRNAVERDRVAHAYLFCGPRGTGKTTTARLLAKAVNCLDPDPRARPCNRCAACLAITSGATTDVIEIDAASNRGIDDIRDLRERVKYAPTQLRSKFYIIDEAHQITGAAGNAFLKTLEEPPAHTKFVLATTDPEDLLPTIVSRCQRFDFRRIALPAAIARLRTVAAAERIEVDDDALAAIARAGTGSLRDSLGLLDQLAVYQESSEESTGPARVTADSVRALMGVSRNDRVETIVRALADRDVSTALGSVNNAVEAGEDPRQLNRQLVNYLRVLMHQLAGGSPDADQTARDLAARFDLYDLAKMAQRFSETDVRIRHASIAQLPFEVAIVESILRPAGGELAPSASPRQASQAPVAASPPSARPAPAPSPSRPADAAAPVERDTGLTEPHWMREMDQPAAAASPPAQSGPSLKDRVRNPSARTSQTSSGQAVEQPVPVASRPPEPARPASAGSKQPAAAASTPGSAEDGTATVTVQRLVELWGRIRQDVKLQNRRIEALLAEVDPISVDGNMVTLRAAYPFHRNRLEEDEVREVVQSAIGKRVGQAIRVRTVLKGEAGDSGAPHLIPAPPTFAAPSGYDAAAHDLPADSPNGNVRATAEPAAPSMPARPAYDGTIDDPTGASPAVRQDDAVLETAGPMSAEDENRLVDAARTIFDAEEVPDPLAEES